MNGLIAVSVIADVAAAVMMISVVVLRVRGRILREDRLREK